MSRCVALYMRAALVVAPSTSTSSSKSSTPTFAFLIPRTAFCKLLYLISLLCFLFSVMPLRRTPVSQCIRYHVASIRRRSLVVQYCVLWRMSPRNCEMHWLTQAIAECTLHLDHTRSLRVKTMLQRNTFSEHATFAPQLNRAWFTDSIVHALQYVTTALTSTRMLGAKTGIKDTFL